jgi:hypothetical protein
LPEKEKAILAGESIDFMPEQVYGYNIMNRLSAAKRVHVVSASVKGNSINAIVCMTAVAKHTLDWSGTGESGLVYGDADGTLGRKARKGGVAYGWISCPKMKTRLPGEPGPASFHLLGW